MMFIERMKDKFAVNEPIFTYEILELFNDYSRAQVFRYISKAMENQELIQFDKGIYYIPKKTIMGLSTICADDVISKKYINYDNKINGIYSGLKLLNMFSVTTQVPNVVEIISNNESTKKREIEIDGRKFILKSSKITIDNNNESAYIVLQLFTDLKNNESLNDLSKRKIGDYIRNKNVSIEQLTSLAMYFPSKTTKNLIRSGLINEIT